MPLTLRPTGFDNRQDWSVIYRHEDGREIHAGRIFYSGTELARDGAWVWTVEFHQRKFRTESHQGHEDTEAEAKAAFKRCWESSDQVQWP